MVVALFEIDRTDLAGIEVYKIAIGEGAYNASAIDGGRIAVLALIQRSNGPACHGECVVAVRLLEGAKDRCIAENRAVIAGSLREAANCAASDRQRVSKGPLIDQRDRAARHVQRVRRASLQDGANHRSSADCRRI